MPNTVEFSATRCPAREMLLAFSSGRLSEADLGTIGLHLEKCETCLAFLDSQDVQAPNIVRDPAISVADQESAKSSLLDDTAFERLRQDSEFQRMKAKAKAIEIGTAGDTATWDPADQKPVAEVLPEKIGRYFVLKKLGQGGFANVYLARDPDQSRLVAIKVPRADKFKNESQVDSFLQEARTAATLDHPHIVPVFDFDRLPGGNCFVVMKYIEGRSLEAAMATEKFTCEQAAQLCAKVADALEYAHQKKFVHRDIKPANILLDGANHPYIADFGLAIHEESQSERRGEYAGTLRYMSPEQVQGRVHHLDGRTDVWSLGVMFYELLTRERPFPSKTVAELEDEILNRAPKPLRSVNREIPEQLERIVLRCLEKKVEDRCANAADVARSLQVWLQSSQLRRHWGAMAAIGAALVLAAGVAAWGVFGLAGWSGGGNTQTPGQEPKNGVPSPATTAQKPKNVISLLETVPIMVFGHPGPDPIFLPSKEFSVGPAAARWIARTYRGPTQRVHLYGTVSLKDWVGTIGFAWQVHDIHELGTPNIHWITVEIYRFDEQDSLKIMVRKMVVGEDVAGDLLKATKVKMPENPTVKLNVLIERGMLRVMFDDQPAIELPAASSQVNNWMEEGELTVALTGEGRRATFKDAQLELLPAFK